ncbi:MAG: sodium/glutamate symporter [Saprospiraceae bacterium]|nr:sodium/glutamate symporter [Saprospiraceae bacterium]
MEFSEGVLQLNSFLSVTIGIIVLFSGRDLNNRFRILRDFNIPVPVTGGLLFSLIFTAVYLLGDIVVEFDMTRRDIMLVYFFTTIGINSKFSDLVTGGKPLAILLSATIGYMVVQDITGITIASLFDLPPQVGLLGGTVSLIGGHGTAIAWAPTFAKEYGISNAMEIGIACATFGLILASVMGGPIAHYLINKHQLKAVPTETPDVGISYAQEDARIDYLSLLHAILSIHIAIIVGFFMNEALEGAGLKLPLFVTCLFAGILLTNLLPHVLPKLNWPTRTNSLAVISDLSLGIFLAMSLMSMQLWTVVELAGPILAILGVQFLVAASLAIFVIFRLMGRNYDAAVISSGFGGISLGSTATAMANMTAVTLRYGHSHLAFIIVPLVCAFFVDIVNAFLIRFLLNQM